MRSGYSTKEIKDVSNALKKMGINAKQAGVSKSGSLKMKEKKNIYTFSRIGDEIVALNLDGFPPVKPFNETDAAEKIQEYLSEDGTFKIKITECSMDMIKASATCHGIKFDYEKAIYEYDRENSTYEELASMIRNEIYEHTQDMFCNKKQDIIEKEITNKIKKLGYEDLIESKNKYSKVLGDEIGRMFRFAGKRPAVTQDGFVLNGSGFSVRYKTAGTKTPEIFDTEGIDKIKDTTETVDRYIWKNEYIEEILKYLSSKPGMSVTCTSKITAANIDSIQKVEIKVHYDTEEFVFDDTFEVPLIENGYDKIVSFINDEYNKFINACNAFIKKEKEKKTKELEEAGLCYQILPYAIYRIVEENNDAVTENMVYNNLFGQRRKRKTNVVEGFTGKFRNIKESRVEEAIRDMKDIGLLKEVYHINEFNNRFYFLALGEEYKGCLPGKCNDSVDQIMQRDVADWTDFDWIKVIRCAEPDCLDMESWLRLMEVFYNEDVCTYCESELVNIFLAAPRAVNAYLEAADIGPCYSRINRKIQILQTDSNSV